MRVEVTYTCDECNQDDQRGVIIIRTPTGKIEAEWECVGGKGRGVGLVNNTTSEFDDVQATKLIDAADLCQGIGTYSCDVSEDHNGWFGLANIEWKKE